MTVDSAKTGFFAKIKGFFSAIGRIVVDYFKKVWKSVSDYWRNTSWKKFCFIDLPIMIGLMALSFTKWALAAEFFIIALGVYCFISGLPNGGHLFKHTIGILFGMLGFGVTWWLWMRYREIALILAFSQIPRLTTETYEVYTTARDTMEDKLAVK